MADTPTVLLLGHNNFVIDKLSEILIQKKCKPIFSNKVTSGDLTKELGSKVLSEIDFVIFISLSTFIFQPNNHLLNQDIRRNNLTCFLLNRYNVKALFIYSYIQKNILQKKIEINALSLLQKYKTRISVVYIGDLVDNYLNISSAKEETIFAYILNKILMDNAVFLPRSFSFNPLFGNEPHETIIKILFSINNYNLKVSILGNPLSVEKLIKAICFNKNNILFLEKNNLLSKPVVDEVIYFKNKKNLKYFFQFLSKKYLLLNRKFPKQVVKTTPNLRHTLLLTIILLFLFPFLSLFISNKLINQGIKSFEKGKVFSSNTYTKIAHQFLFFSKPFTVNINFLNEPHSLMLKQTEILFKLNSIAKNTYKIYKNTVDKDIVLSNDLYPEIIRDLGNINQNLSQIQTDLTSQNYFIRQMISPKVDIKKLQTLKTQTADLIVLFGELPDVLGEKEIKKYLITIEDPNYLMPGGGRIKNALLVTFFEGKIIDKSSIDPELGKNSVAKFVNAPSTYKELLKDGWYFKNSNIYTDFVMSAEQILFFLDKQQDIKVDGMISLNTDLPTNAKDLEGKKYFDGMYFLLSNALNTNDVQLFLKNETLQNIIANFGWNGAIKKTPCLNICFKDILNYFELSLNDQSKIFRYLNIQISLEEKIIKRKIDLSLMNKGNDPYKGYINFLVPENVGFSPVVVQGEKEILTKNSEVLGLKNYKIINILVEVLPFSSKKVQLSWDGGTELDQKNLNEYVLFLGRQGGIKNVDISVNIKTSNKNIYWLDPNFTLTESGNLVYNAQLWKDKIIKLYFK